MPSLCAVRSTFPLPNFVRALANSGFSIVTHRFSPCLNIFANP